MASQTALAGLMGVSVATLKRALEPLRDGLWVEVVRVGSERGGVNAYLINRRVAWADKRDNMRYAAFDARVLVSADEQDDTADKPALRSLPTMYPGDVQLPAGEGAEPPSQPSLEGLEPDLPHVSG